MKEDEVQQLRSMRDNLVAEIAELTTHLQERRQDLVNIEAVLRRKGVFTEIAEQGNSDEQTLNPFDTAKRLFADNPERRISITDIRDHLASRRQMGLLKSMAQNLHFSAIDICRRLHEQGFLEKGKEGKQVWYRLKQAS